MSKTVSLYEDRELKTFNNIPAIRIGSDYWIPEDEANYEPNSIINRNDIGDYDISGKQYSLNDSLSFISLPPVGTKEFNINFRYGATTMCKAIKIGTSTVTYTLTLSNQDVQVYNQSGWANTVYKDITILSPAGSDSSNANLWYWLFYNDINKGDVRGSRLVNLYIDAIAGKYKKLFSDSSSIASLDDLVNKFLMHGGV